MCAGGATTAVYASTSAADVAFILADSGSRIAFAEDDAQIAKLRAQRDHLPDLIRVVTFDGHGRRRVGDRPGGPAGPGRRAPRRAPDRRRRRGGRRPARPPGHADLHVRHHGAAQGRRAAPPLLDLHRRRRRGASASSAATTCSTSGCRWRTPSGRCSRRCSCRSGSPRPSTAASTRSWTTSPVVRPTFMAGPPRIFEKVHAAVVQAVEAEGGLRLRLFRLGVRRSAAGCGGPALERQDGRAGPAGPSTRWPTGWCCRRCAPGSAAGSASSSRAARPSPRTSPLVRRRGPAGDRGLRAHRDRRRCLHQQPEHPTPGVVGPPLAGLRGQDRRRRRDPASAARW